ncbi:hydroxyacylglutathione hydrolase [Thalassospiraceae bacterium LMO-JJ14]|nr:hydroxyacylglutathione hydrolase [Thalassospiraceae bacterium LMO-JJ14]
MSKLEIKQIPVLNDNYVYLAHCPETGATGVVDPAVAGPVLDTLEQTGWTLTHILNTHHHNDHTGGNMELKNATGCTIVGPRADKDRIPGIDVEVGDGDTYTMGAASATVFDVPGHTRGHIAYWFADSDALFCGDTLFVMGCGRLFEGTPAQMVNSLAKFEALPGETRVYCAHEYTQSNGRFALSVDPDNDDLIKLMDEVNDKRARGIPTVPSTLAQERRTNPFLRPSSAGIQATLGMQGADIVDVFAEVRKRKDNF